MAENRSPTRLAVPDPGAIVEDARRQRGPIVAGWLSAVVARLIARPRVVGSGQGQAEVTAPGTDAPAGHGRSYIQHYAE